MLLADGINLPIVAALGLVTFGPLTLLVSLIEAFVFRAYLRTSVRTVFKRLLWANVLSTLIAGPMLLAQDALVYATGMQESIPAFVRGFRWLGPLLILIYFTKSALVEGFVLTRRSFLTRIQRSSGRALAAVLLGNLASYLVVGPLFYITNRPHFGGLETTFDTRWTANPETVIYFIDSDDKTVKRARLDGTQAAALVPFPATSFLVSADESTCAFISPDGQLCVHRAGDSSPIVVREGEYRHFISDVSLSPDNRRVSYREPPSDRYLHAEGAETAIKCFDLGTREVVELGAVPRTNYGFSTAWSADGTRVYVEVVHYHNKQVGMHMESSETREVHVLSADPPYGVVERLTAPPPLRELVENYVRARGRETYSGGTATIWLPEKAQADELSFDLNRYLGSRMTVQRGDERVLFLQNAYGLLNFGMPPIWQAAFAPHGGEIVLEWSDQIYLLNAQTRRLGLVANGEQFVLRTPEFRVSFDP